MTQAGPAPSRGEARGRGRRSAALAALVVVLAGSCQAPARTYPPFEADAVATAEGAQSAVETALLAARTGAEGNAYANYLSTVLGDAEDTATAVQGSFDLEQPPNHAADELRARLDDILARASAVLARLRIEVRRGEVDRLAEVARPLEQVSADLDDFIQEHE